uniref:Uncharacterized protein n=1 Tax=Pseudothermotoga hypogea TaxID=57487 RepID=A0A832I910_9THEM
MRYRTMKWDKKKMCEILSNTSFVLIKPRDYGSVVAIECNPAVRPGGYGSEPVRHSYGNFKLKESSYALWLCHKGKLERLAHGHSHDKQSASVIATFVARVIGYANMMNWKIDSVKLAWGSYTAGVYLALFHEDKVHLFEMTYTFGETKYQEERLIGFAVKYLGHGIGSYDDNTLVVFLADRSIAIQLKPREACGKVIENELITIHHVLSMKKIKLKHEKVQKQR